MSASMEQAQHQWALHDHEQEEVEEVEDAALERRKFLPHSKDILITGVVESSSSSSSSSSSYSPGGNGSKHSNGVFTAVNDPDGSLVQKEEEHEEMGSVGENGNHFNNDKEDCEAVGLGIVAEFEEAAANGEAVTGATFGAARSQKMNSVYFDRQQGNEINGLNGIQNGDGPRCVIPTNHVEREFDVQVEDAVIPNSLSNEVNNECMKTVDDKVPSSSELSHLHNSSDIQATFVTKLDDETNTKEGPKSTKEIDHQLKEYDVEGVLAKQETHDLFCPNCNSCITKRVILKKRKRIIHNLDNKAKRDKLDSAVVSSNLVDSFAQEANQGDQANVMPEIVSLEQADDNHDPEREPEVFRCLSCFSFFIPSGKCFNLFRNIGGAREHETSQIPLSVPASSLQNPSNVPGSNANWLFSIFTSNKGKTARKQGDASIEHSRTDAAEQLHSTRITSNVQTTSEIGHPEGSLADTATVKNVNPSPHTDHGDGGLNSLNSSTVDSVKTKPPTENDIKSNMVSGNEPLSDQKCREALVQNDLSSVQASTKGAGDVKTKEGEKKNDPVDITKTNNFKDLSPVRFSDEMVPKHDSVPLATGATTEMLVNAVEPAEDAILNSHKGKPEFLVPTTVESPILDKSPTYVDKTAETIQKSYSSLGQGTQSPVQSFGSAVLAGDVASNKQSYGIDAVNPSKQDFTLNGKVQKDIEEEINPSDRKENKGGDVIVLVEGEAVNSATSQMVDNVPVEGAIMTESYTQGCIGEQPTAEIGEPKEWEILKSIVYGGLVESITSLGIVASAASSGAAPLNIIALGLANLVGGLFILGHNLGELKNDHSEGDQQQITDRYQELLGRRSNFMLHAVVAVLSFLIFGSVPIVIYGLLINKNYYAEVKLAAMAATSVLCVILLAIGKVYTKRSPKSYVKTVSYYVTLTVAASGVSYIGGSLIKDLLEKFTHSESGFAITMPISDNGMEPAWVSY